MEIINNLYAMQFPRRQTRIVTQQADTQLKIAQILERAKINFAMVKNNEMKDEIRVHIRQPETLDKLTSFLKNRQQAHFDYDPLVKMLMNDLTSAIRINRFY